MNANYRDFNNLDTNFFTETYLDALKQANQGCDQIFVPFQVIIPSLMYVGTTKYTKKGQQKTETNIGCSDIMFSFRKAYRRQLGTHIFIDRWGDMCLLETFNEYFKVPNEKDKSEIWYWSYTSDNCISINSVYPVNRYEWQHKLKRKQLVYGLKYVSEDLKAGNKTGDRYYHREGEGCLQFSGTQELTDERLIEIIERTSKEKSEQSFALFVCCGAKLTLMDELPKAAQQKTTHHNRSFIQQGGVIHSTSALEFEIPHMNTRYLNSYNAVTRKWEQFVDMLQKPEEYFDKKVRTANDGINLLKDYKNPVLFLGANYSQFNSIAWSLKVLKNRTHLCLPEGGRIIAIADGVEGMREIRARIHYEMLLDSVLTNHDIQFAAPVEPITETVTSKDPKSEPKQTVEEETKNDTKNEPKIDVSMIKRILNLEEERSFVYSLGREEYEDRNSMNFTPKFEQVESVSRKLKTPSYPEFNFMYWRKTDTNWTDEVLRDVFGQKPPPMPPMYPPYREDLNPAIPWIYLPNCAINRNIDSVYHYMNEVYPRLSLVKDIHPKNNTYFFKGFRCKLAKSTRTDGETVWTRLQDKNIQFDDQTVLKDGDMYRIGVDGWIWQRGTQPGFKGWPYATVFYRKQ